jgi:hypothetical protein
MTARPPRDLVRSPAELVPLIERELDRGHNAYRAVGALLLEAKQSLPHGRFKFWVRDHFADVSYRQASNYMRMAGAKSETRFTFREVKADPATRRSHYTAAMEQRRLEKLDDRDQLRELAYQIVVAGFRVCALKLHPDRPGGSVEKMALLTETRRRLLDHWTFQ